MQRGKNICKELKAVRHRIAEENGIPLEERECTYDGPCRGTCPRCEAEVRYLERELSRRIKLGRVASVAGITLGLTACGGADSPAESPMGGPTPDILVVSDSLPQGSDSLMYVDSMPEPPVFPPDVVMGIVEEIEPETDDTVGEIEVVDVVVDDELQEGEEEIYVLPEVDPVFPGGTDSLYAFIARNIKYPAEAKMNRIEGKVYVSFVIEKDGSVSSARVFRDIGGGCGQEALRVIRLMPRWAPATQSGVPVRFECNLPIRFRLPAGE